MIPDSPGRVRATLAQKSIQSTAVFSFLRLNLISLLLGKTLHVHVSVPLTYFVINNTDLYQLCIFFCYMSYK